MTFINEQMSSEDIEKFGIAEIDDRFFKGHYRPIWTVDHQRNIYLRRMTMDREFHFETYTFFWKGTLLAMHLLRGSDEVQDIHSVQPTSTKFSIYPMGGYTTFTLPTNLEAHRAEITSDLKEALTVFMDQLLIDPSTHTISFDF